MNRRLHSFTVSLIVIALSLGAGFMVRHWLQKTPAAKKMRPVITSPFSPDAPSSLLHRADFAALGTESAESLKALGTELQESWKGENPLRLQAAVMLRILRGARSSADFAAALPLLSGQPEEGSLDEHLVAPLAKILFERWAAVDPAAALTGTLRMAGRQSQYQLTNAVMKVWAANDPQGALTFVLTQPKPLSGDAASALFGELGRRDPALAMTLAAQAGEHGLMTDMAALVLRPWSDTDPAAAFQWITEYARPEKRFALADACLQGANSKLGLEATVAKFSALGLTAKERDILTGRAVSMGYLGNDKPEPVLKAIASIQDDETRRETVSSLAALGNYPADQTGAFLDGLPAGPDRDAFLYGRARAGIISDDHFNASESLERITDVPSPKNQDELWRELGGRWGGRDPVAVSHWLTDEPPGPRRDAVAGELVRSLVRTDPEAALLWSASISDPGKRSRRLAELLPQWSAKDDTAARSWLESATVLSESDRTALQSVLAKTVK